MELIYRDSVKSSLYCCGKAIHIEKEAGMGKILTRYGDGTPVELDESDVMRDLEDGTRDAAERGNIPELSREELQHLFDIFNSPHRFIGVESGKEVVLSYDGTPIKMSRAQVNVDRLQCLQIYEKLMGADTLEMGAIDYSFKPVKPIVTYEQPLLEQTLAVTTAPIFYGAMPNLGLYSQPDGPFPNPAELLPQGKIEEARESYDKSVEHAVRDIVYVSSAMYESGADAIILDTVGAAGDADFLAALKATAELREKYPGICVELGMAGEFVLGMHGEMTYDGELLAGKYPHDQVKIAEKAGVTIFGPVVNTNTNESAPWNVSRSITFMKACCEVANIPVHVNMGMGVGAITVHDHPPLDVASRASKAMVEICRLDGL
jgi:dimethylamine--corrinoid protein Co-methyltransferase